MKLQTHDLSYFPGNFFFVMMVYKISLGRYQPTLHNLELKKDKNTDFVLWNKISIVSWK